MIKSQSVVDKLTNCHGGHLQIATPICARHGCLQMSAIAISLFIYSISTGQSFMNFSICNWLVFLLNRQMLESLHRICYYTMEELAVERLTCVSHHAIVDPQGARWLKILAKFNQQTQYSK